MSELQTPFLQSLWSSCNDEMGRRESLSRLMNIRHHHVVVTLPKSFRKLSKMNGDKLHDELFKCGAKVIKDWFEEHHNLRIGIVSVLHTAGSDLKYHPHVHMIVSRGGQDLTTGEYRELKGNTFANRKSWEYG